MWHSDYYVKSHSGHDVAHVAETIPRAQIAENTVKANDDEFMVLAILELKMGAAVNNLENEVAT